MTIFQECLAYLLMFYPDWWSYLKVDGWQYKDFQQGLQN